MCSPNEMKGVHFLVMPNESDFYEKTTERLMASFLHAYTAEYD